jgi:hypothetical protein
MDPYSDQPDEIARMGEARVRYEEPDTAAFEPRKYEIRVVINTEAEPPHLLGVLMDRQPDDENVVRYYDTGPDEEEHFAPEDCVAVETITVWIPFDPTQG